MVGKHAQATKDVEEHRLPLEAPQEMELPDDRQLYCANHAREAHRAETSAVKRQRETR